MHWSWFAFLVGLVSYPILTALLPAIIGKLKSLLEQ